MVEITDVECIKRCLNGHPEAFEMLVDRYHTVVFNIAYRMTGSMDSSEDISQNVFLKGYDHLKDYDSKYRFYSWLYRIAVNESLNYIKKFKQTNELKSKMASADKNPEEQALDSEMRGAVQNAIMKLDPQYRALIILKHFQNFSYKEIAGIYDIPEKKVKSRLYTARQMLKEILVCEGILAYD